MTKNNDINLRIGMVRQWLNEDRITDPKKMITNEDLKHWLDPAIEALLVEARVNEVLDILTMLQVKSLRGFISGEEVKQNLEDRIAQLKEGKKL